VAYASEVDFAATTTRGHCQKLFVSIDREIRTCVSILCQVNRNLSANSSRSPHHQCHFAVLRSHYYQCCSRKPVQRSPMDRQMRRNCHCALIELDASVARCVRPLRLLVIKAGSSGPRLNRQIP
jgi:hypothetical protein